MPRTKRRMKREPRTNGSDERGSSIRKKIREIKQEPECSGTDEPGPSMIEAAQKMKREPGTFAIYKRIKTPNLATMRYGLHGNGLKRRPTHERLCYNLALYSRMLCETVMLSQHLIKNVSKHFKGEIYGKEGWALEELNEIVHGVPRQGVTDLRQKFRLFTRGMKMNGMKIPGLHSNEKELKFINEALMKIKEEDSSDEDESLCDEGYKSQVLHGTKRKFDEVEEEDSKANVRRMIDNANYVNGTEDADETGEFDEENCAEEDCAEEDCAEEDCDEEDIDEEDCDEEVCDEEVCDEEDCNEEDCNEENCDEENCDEENCNDVEEGSEEEDSGEDEDIDALYEKKTNEILEKMKILAEREKRLRRRELMQKIAERRINVSNLYFKHNYYANIRPKYEPRPQRNQPELEKSEFQFKKPHPVQPDFEFKKPHPIQPEFKKPQPKNPEPKMAEPKQPDFEFKKPQPKTPESEKPEPKQPEPKQSEPKQSEPKQPEPKQPEPKQPEPKQPEPKQPEPKQPEPKQPELKHPEIKPPEAKQPEPKKPQPKKAEPEKSALKKSEPEKPELKKPEPRRPEPKRKAPRLKMIFIKDN